MTKKQQTDQVNFEVRLSVKERVLLSNLMPVKGDFRDVLMGQVVKEKLVFAEDELTSLGMVTVSESAKGKVLEMLAKYEVGDKAAPLADEVAALFPADRLLWNSEAEGDGKLFTFNEDEFAAVQDTLNKLSRELNVTVEVLPLFKKFGLGVK